MASEGGAGSGVELAVGAAVDFARTELEGLEILAEGSSAWATACGAPGSPGKVSSCSMVIWAVKSGCGLEITIANCCAAALRLESIIALSRSTAQYSHPTLLRAWRA